MQLSQSVYTTEGVQVCLNFKFCSIYLKILNYPLTTNYYIKLLLATAMARPRLNHSRSFILLGKRLQPAGIQNFSVVCVRMRTLTSRDWGIAE